MHAEIDAQMRTTIEEEDHLRRAPFGSRRRGRWLVPLGALIGYAVFAGAVHLRLLDGLDVAVRQVAIPGGIWGPTQIRANHVVDTLAPTHLAVPLLAVVLGLCLFRRSLRAFVVLALVGVPVVVVTLGSKWAMAHADPGTVPVGHGSFPSGHLVSIVLAFGVAVLLCRPGTRWGWLVPVAMGCLMGSALVLAAVHPATDVIGAGLLAAGALAAATTAGLGTWANATRPSSARPGRTATALTHDRG
jgi:membrane-associated phospholipid phosphatase